MDESTIKRKIMNMRFLDGMWIFLYISSFFIFCFSFLTTGHFDRSVVFFGFSFDSIFVVIVSIISVIIAKKNIKKAYQLEETPISNKFLKSSKFLLNISVIGLTLDIIALIYLLLIVP